MTTTSTQIDANESVYYENYFEVDVQLQVAGQNIDVPEHDFMLRFYTKGGSSHFDCMRRGGKFVNCSPSADGTTIECHLSEHGLMPGQLLVKYYDFSPNVNFLRGQKLVIEPAMQVPVMLTTTQSDSTTKVAVDVAADIITIISDAKVLIEKLKNAKYIESFEVNDTDTPGEHNTLTVHCSDGKDVVLRSRNGLDGETAVFYSLTLSSAFYKADTTTVSVGVMKHSGGSVEQLTALPKGWKIKVHWEGAELSKDSIMGIGTLNPNELAGATSVTVTLYDGDPMVSVDGATAQAIDTVTLLLVADGKDGTSGIDGKTTAVYSIALSSAVYKDDTASIGIIVTCNKGDDVVNVDTLPSGWKIRVTWNGSTKSFVRTFSAPQSFNPNEIEGTSNVEVSLYNGDPEVLIDGQRAQLIATASTILISNAVSGLYTKIGAADADKLSQPNAHFLVVEDVPITGTVKLGSGSIVSFLQGKGKFTGSGTIDLNGAVIDAPPKQEVFGTSLNFAGLFGNAEIYPEWWGAKGDGTTDDALAINTAIKYAGHTKVRLCAEQYLVKSTINAVEPDAVSDINSDYNYTNSSGTDYNVRKQIEVMHDIIGDASLEGAVIRTGTASNELTVHGAVVVRNNSDKAIGVSMLGGSESSYGVNDFNTDNGKLYIDSIIHGHDSFPAPYIEYADSDTETYGVGKGTGIILSGIKSNVVINSIFGFEKGAWLSYVQSSTIEITAMGNINDIYVGILEGQKYGKSVTRSKVRVGYHMLNKKWNWVSVNENPISIFNFAGTCEVACNDFSLGSNNNVESYYYDYIIYGSTTCTNYLGNRFDISATLVAPSGRTNWKPICMNQEKFSYSCNGNYYNHRVAWGYKHIAACKEYNSRISPVIIKGNTYTTIYRYGNNNAADSFLCDVIVTTPNAPLLTSGSTDEAIRIIVPHHTMVDRIHWTDTFPTDTSGNLIGTSFEKGHLYAAENEKTGSFYNCYAWEDGTFKKVGVIKKDNKLHVYDGSTDVDVADRLSGLESNADELKNAQTQVTANLLKVNARIGELQTDVNAKYTKPEDGIPVSDLSTDLQKKVREISPKEALFIDLWNDVTKPFSGKYNEDTGYYEMNGLTDITYDEAVALYNQKNREGVFSQNLSYRTVIFTNINTSAMHNFNNAFAGAKGLIVVDFVNTIVVGENIFGGCSNLKSILRMKVYDTLGTNSFRKCASLSTLNVAIFANGQLIVQDSPLITYDSFKYIIDYAQNTAARTITVHPNSYAYLQGTTAPIEAVGGTTEQWQALVTAATAKQISFAEGTPTT